MLFKRYYVSWGPDLAEHMPSIYQIYWSSA